MKIHYNSLCCPNCGSTKYEIIDNGVFVCDYCDGKFNFDLDELVSNAENKVLVEELRSQFYGKILEFNEIKAQHHALLIYYKKLAYPQKLHNFSVILLVISFFAMFSFMFTPLIFLVLTTIALGVGLLVFSKRRNKKLLEKYLPIITEHAKKVVECEDKIETYTKLVSKLTVEK